MTRRKYLRDSVTGRPYDPDTKQWLDEQVNDAVRGEGVYDARVILRSPHAQVMQHPHAPIESTRQPKRPQQAVDAGAPTYTPPAGLPANPPELLAYLRAGNFTDAQLAYLRGNARDVYARALAHARTNPDLAAEVALGDEIIAAWLAALAVLGPAPVSNPFQVAP